MPIRPENAKRYPADWKTVVVPRIRARSGNRCECTGQCGVRHPDHLLITGNLGDNRVVIREPNRCGKWNGMPIDDFEGPKIVLTVAHLDHMPENCDDNNLLHLCQGCHNRYDAPVRRAGIKHRARMVCAAGDLFDGSTDPVRALPGRPVEQEALSGREGPVRRDGGPDGEREAVGGPASADQGATG